MFHYFLLTALKLSLQLEAHLWPMSVVFLSLWLSLLSYISSTDTLFRFLFLFRFIFFSIVIMTCLNVFWER